MKRFCYLFLLLACPALADVEWRSFENADKTKSFVGRLVGYEPTRKKVTVQKKSTLRPVSFNVALLSEEHRKFVEERAVEVRHDAQRLAICIILARTRAQACA